MAEPAISVEGVTKTFRTRPRRQPVVAVQDLSLTVEPGSVVAFIGPNGAGKTTTILLLLGLLEPDSGTIRLFGQSAGTAAVRRRVGFLSEIFHSYPYHTARRALRFYGRLSEADMETLEPGIPGLLHRVGLRNAADRKVGTFSKGMMQRLGLAQALFHRPDLLILDEPTTGLDPEGRHLVGDIIGEEHAKGTTVFLSSHILSDVERHCDKVVMIRDGKVVLSKALSELNSDSDAWEIEVPELDGTMREQLSTEGIGVFRKGEAPPSSSATPRPRRSCFVDSSTPRWRSAPSAAPADPSRTSTCSTSAMIGQGETGGTGFAPPDQGPKPMRASRPNPYREIWKNTLVGIVRSKVFYVGLFLTVIVAALSVMPYLMMQMASRAGETDAVVQFQAQSLLLTIGLWSAATTGLGLFIGATLISSEVKTKTIVTVLAKPLDRSRFLVAKWLGMETFLLAFLAAGVLVAVVAILAFGAQVSVPFWLGVLRSYLGVVIASSAAMALATVTSPVFAAGVPILLAMLGGFMSMADRSPFAGLRALSTAFHLLMPASFTQNIMAMGLDREPIALDLGLVVQVLVENAGYALVLVLLASLVFRSRELRLR